MITAENCRILASLSERNKIIVDPSDQKECNEIVRELSLYIKESAKFGHYHYDYFPSHSRSHTINQKVLNLVIKTFENEGFHIVENDFGPITISWKKKN